MTDLEERRFVGGCDLEQDAGVGLIVGFPGLREGECQLQRLGIPKTAVTQKVDRDDKPWRSLGTAFGEDAEGKRSALAVRPLYDSVVGRRLGGWGHRHEHKDYLE